MIDVSGIEWPHRRRARRVALLMTIAVASLYVAVFFVQLPHIHELDNPAPGYLALAALYGVGALLQVRRDTRATYWVGAAVQAVLIGLFVWLLAGMYAHDEESFILNMVGLAIAVNATQVALLALFVWLATHTPRHWAEPQPGPDTTPSLRGNPAPKSQGT